ncbi:cupredoxin domain-containing protein [Kitasatospora sp. NPDC094028]
MRGPGRAVAALLLGAALGGCVSALVGPSPGESGTGAAPSPGAASSRPAATATGPAGSATSPAGTAPGTVTIRDFVYQPADFTVPAGTRVTVVNADTVSHTLTAQDGSFDTGPIAPGASAVLTAPARPGDYPYRCTFHHFMRGTLTVA